MNAYSRPAFLHSVFIYLESNNVTLTELLSFVLVSEQLNDPSRAIYADLLRNAKTILSAFYYHHATGPSVRAWAHDAMRAHYADAVQSLSRTPDWHFVASQAQPKQICDFRIEDMASEMEKRVPVLWSLMQSLLSGVGAGDRQNVQMDVDSEGSAHPGPSRSEVVDSEDEYYEDEEDGDGETDGGEGGAEGPGMLGNTALPAEHTSATAGVVKRRKRRRVPQHKIDRIKTVVMLSILMQNRDQKANALQSTIGVFLHASNTPERVIKVLSRMGVSVSLTSIHRAIHSLSDETCSDVQTLGQTLLASYGYDNFELQLPTGIPTVEKPGEGLLHLTSGILLRLEHGVTLDDLRCSELLWNRSANNPRAPDPRPFDPHKTMRHLYSLHREAHGPDDALTRRGRFRMWVFQKTLFEHGPAGFKSLRGNLADPEPIDAIPIVKTHYVPLRTMDLNQSKVSGNIDAILNMLSQAGVGAPAPGSSGPTGGTVDISEFVTLVHGDLGTYERVLSATRRRSVEFTPYDRLQSVVFVVGLFHLKMAAADAIWRLLVAPDGARSDPTSFMRIVGKLRPRDSSRLVSNAKFRQQHELIGHVLTVFVMDAWRVEVHKRMRACRTLEDWAASKPKLADIDSIATSLAQEYAEGEGIDLFDQEGQPASARDEVLENTRRTLHYLLLYEELCYAMNAGDIGRLETVLVPWIQIFRATGKHKYGTQLLRFMHALYFIYPERLRRAVRYNILVNPTGKPHEFRAVDWIVELLNLYTKVIYGGEGSNYTKARIILESVLVVVFRSSLANLERNFCLRGLTRAHGTKNMAATFTAVLGYIQELLPNEYKAGRTSQYVIPDALGRGAAIIEAESRVGRTGRSEADAEGAMDQMEAEMEDGHDLLDVELTADDLSVECDI